MTIENDAVIENEYTEKERERERERERDCMFVTVGF